MVATAHLSPVERGQILDVLPTSVLIVDAAGVVDFANERAARMLERDGERVAGENIDNLLAPLSRLLELAPLQRTERVLDLALPSGRHLAAGFSLERHGDDGKYVILFNDIADWQALRDERDRLLKLAAVGSALPSLLHELKNPLAAITSVVELLVEEMPPGENLDQLYAVLSEVRRMKLILNGVSAAGRVLRSHRYAAVDHACREAFTIMAARAREAGVMTRCDVPDMPLLPFDPAMVSGIVYNLMVNAIQACPPGATVKLYAHLSAAGDTFLLGVIDNGPGMSADVYRRCTELFFTTRRSGSGIGLALCARSAEEAGGQLSIESVPGFGTHVRVEVPVRAAQRPPPPPSPSHSRSHSHAAAAGAPDPNNDIANPGR